MGKWKRKKQAKALEKALSTASSSSINDEQQQQPAARSFNFKDRKMLRNYLTEYRDGALSMYYNNNDGTEVACLDPSQDPIVIGGCTFSFLTELVLRQPYLSLPQELSSKQRRIVHAMCVDVELFHCGVGGNRDDRYLAISVYSNGLSKVPGIIMENEHPTDMRKFKPWGCRRETITSTSTSTITSMTIDPEQATKKAKEEIYKMIDQPGECLRDGIDTIDFEQIEHDDLSKTTPPAAAEDKWMLIDTAEKMQQCIQEIEDLKPTEIAFDLECYNQSKYAQMTCLIQIALSTGKEYVIDPLAHGVWDTIGGLAPIFADPSIVKIGHSIGGLDICCLHRDFGIFVVNAFDTYEAAQCLQMKSKGLAKVCSAYGLPNCETYEDLKSQYQTTDWTKRPLTKPMIEYGRYDVHYLVQLRKLMMRDLAKRELWDKARKADQYAEAKAVATSLSAILRKFDEDEASTDDEDDPEDANGLDDIPSMDDDDSGAEENGECQSFYEARELRVNLDLMQAISRSQDRCLDLWSNSPEPPMKNNDYQDLVVRCGKEGVPFTQNQLLLYERLADWREMVARKEECSAGFVCPLGLLAAVALKRPTTKVGLRRLTDVLPHLLDDEGMGYTEELFGIVRSALLEEGIDGLDDQDVPIYGKSPPPPRKSSKSIDLSSSATSEKIGRFAVGVTACVAVVGIAVALSRKRG